MTDPGEGPLLIGEIFLFEPQGHIDQGNEHWYLDQGADDRGKGLAGVDALYP